MIIDVCYIMLTNMLALSGPVVWGFVPCSTISNRRFGDRTVSIFKGSYADRFPQLCYRGNTVTERFHRGTLLKFKEHLSSEIVLHDRKPQKTSIIDTAVKAFQQTIFFEL
jgi:hypothetical protein